MSNLEKNQDLKAILLEETPWVMRAQDERERKERIAVLFDMERMAREETASLQKLQELQREDGSWPWFGGMFASRSITQHIVAGIGHLERLGAADLDVGDLGRRDPDVAAALVGDPEHVGRAGERRLDSRLELVPLAVVDLVRLMEEVGFPPGVVNVVTSASSASPYASRIAPSIRTRSSARPSARSSTRATATSSCIRSFTPRG